MTVNRMFRFNHNTILLLILNLLILFVAQRFQDIPSFLKFKTPSTSPTTPDRMSSNDTDILTLTPLSLWLQSQFSALYESTPATEEVDFKTMYYNTFADNAQIYINHEKVTEEAYLARFKSANFAVIHSSVDWKELMEVPPVDDEHNVGAGIVAGFFVVKRAMKFRIRAGPAERLSFNTFSAKIDAKPEVEPAADGSRLRVTELFITSVEKAAPIHLRSIPPHDTEIHPTNT